MLPKNARKARQTATSNETLRAIKALVSGHVYRIFVRTMNLGGEAAVLRLAPAYSLPRSADEIVAMAASL